MGESIDFEFVEHRSKGKLVSFCPGFDFCVPIAGELLGFGGVSLETEAGGCCGCGVVIVVVVGVVL